MERELLLRIKDKAYQVATRGAVIGAMALGITGCTSQQESDSARGENTPVEEIGFSALQGGDLIESSSIPAPLLDQEAPAAQFGFNAQSNCPPWAPNCVAIDTERTRTFQDAARVFWGSSIEAQFYNADLGANNIYAKAETPGTRIYFNRQIAVPIDPGYENITGCTITAHEWGHLRGKNHSVDTLNIMYKTLKWRLYATQECLGTYPTPPWPGNNPPQWTLLHK